MIKKVDIVVPIYNAKKYTEMCLSSIISKTEDCNIIIVDNGSDKETQEYLMDFAVTNKNISLLRQDKNVGFVGAVNIGVEYARSNCKSPLIAIITSDTICSTGWLQSMAAHIKDDVVMVGPTSNAVAGRQQVQYNNAEYTHEYAEWLIGFFTLIRADIVDQLTIFDGFFLDELFNYGSSDDLDLSLRLRKMGYRLCIDRKTYIHHHLSKGLIQQENVKKEGLDKVHAKYFNIFQKKHKIESVNQREPFVFIGVPSVSEKMDYRFWLSTVTQNLNFKHIWAPPIIREMPDMARNKLAHMALDYGCSHLCIIDDDMIYDDQNLIIKLLGHDKDIVGVRAYTRKPPYYPCVFYKVESGFYQEMDFDSCGLREVDGLGMAATLINLEVFRKMPEPWFKFHEVKVLGRGDDRFGEDLYFCRKAKELGFKVWCDTDIETVHVGDNQLISRKTYHNAIGKKS